MTAARASRRRVPVQRQSFGSGVDRVTAAAYELFSRRGVRTVGVDEIIALSGVAKATFYRNFASKNDLIIAYLRRRHQVWTVGWVQAETEQRATSPREQLLAIFDIFDEWFQKGDFEGCPFISTVSHGEPKDRVRSEAAAQLRAIKAYVRGLAEQAHLADPDRFAGSWHILMQGSILMALGGDRAAARNARGIGEAFLAAYPKSA
jgi:AcrR family transcriptional regulator